LSQLSRKLAIASLLVRIKAQSVMHKVVVHGSRRMCRPILILVRVIGSDEGQFVRHRHPDSLPSKSLLVAVEVLETLARHRVTVHRRVLLVAEGDAGAGDAFAAGFGALRADGTLFAAFELSMTGQPIILIWLSISLSMVS
jgi:hypothetical protein